MHRRFHLLLLISLLGLGIPGITPTHANSVFTVTSTADIVDVVPGDAKCATAGTRPICTLRAAIQESNALPGADVIVLPLGTYTLTGVGTNEQAAATGDLDILGELTITGGGAAVTTIDAKGIDRVFEVMQQAIVHITGVTIQGGNPGNTPGYTHGGGIMNKGMLTLDASTIRGNIAQYGAGIYSEGGSLALSGSTIEQNTAHGDGGGISASSTVTLIESTLRSNHATGYGSSGGGFYNYGTLVVRNSSVVSNTAEANGGGIANYMTLRIADSLISENAAAGAGGGIHNPAATGTTLATSRVTNNTAGSQGGGIWNNGNLLQITESSITGNTAASAGGGVWVAGTVRLERSTVAGNRAADGGGFANLTSLELIDSTVADNQATSGGGVANMQGAWLRIAGSSISGNAAALGGGISNRGTIAVINSTFSANTAAIDGGGILAERFSSPYGVIDLANVTLSSNVADNDGDGSGNGGGIAFVEGSITVRNSIVAGNIDRGGQAPDCWGTLTSQGYNLIGQLSGCTIWGETAGNLFAVDPLLSALQENGGPTFTHALRPGSPAIDAGTPFGCIDDAGQLLISDQRGAARPQDGDDNGTSRCDIGAFEVGIAPNTPTPTQQPTTTPAPAPTATPTETPLPSMCLAYGVADAGQAASQFFTFDPRLGTVQALGPLHPGTDIEAIAIHPQTGTVYAASGDDGVHEGFLFRVDSGSGTLTAIGSAGVETIDALAFHPSNGSLWGWAAGQGLIQIDPATGAAQLIYPARGSSSALAWSADGALLFGASGTTLWTYDPVMSTVTTISTAFPATSILLSPRPNGRVLGGVDDGRRLTLFLFDPDRREIIARMRIAVPYSDLETVAWPGACADTIFSALPAIAPRSAVRGAPASYFGLQAMDFTPGSTVTLMVNGGRVGTVGLDGTGQAGLTMFFDTYAPIGTYTIEAVDDSAAVAMTVRPHWFAAAQITIDAQAARLPDPGDAPIIQGVPATYLPFMQR